MIKSWREQGVPVSTIAERLDVCRQTVYNHLNRTEPFPKPRANRASKLDAYKSYIRARLAEFDLPATVLYREIKRQGYPGKMTILREFVRTVKDERITELTERFETEPGRQAQIDWGHCGTIEQDGKRKKLYLFVFVLGYSRMLVAQFTTSTKRHVLLRCLQRAFSRLGVPTELLLDNMKQAVDQHRAGHRPVFNAEFLSFCDHYNTCPVASPPYWPRVKGKVERGVGYIKHSFLEGRAFRDLEDLNQQLESWLERQANARIHATTGQRPVDRYEMERSSLLGIEAIPTYDTRPSETRQVHTDSHIRYDGVRYSVHPDAANKTVSVRSYGEQIGDCFEVYLGDRLVASHRRVARHHRNVTTSQHAAEIHRRIKQGKRHGSKSFTAPRFRQTSESLSPPAWPAIDVQTRSLTSYQKLLEGVAP